jgi:4-hydroxyacetophenone monooxygenase
METDKEDVLLVTAQNVLHDRLLPIADAGALRDALEQAQIGTLLMVYVHYTHDTAMLDAFGPYMCSPYSLEPANVPMELETDLRAKLFDLLTQSPPPAVRAIPDALLKRMMSVFVVEEVADEFLPLLKEQMGFELPVARKKFADRTPPPAGFKVLVIGAGMTGIVASIKLAEAGYDHIVIEKNADVGGTWFENCYPGVGVDTPSHFYSFSFEINPEWNHYHPMGGDMQDYMVRVARKYSVHERTEFNTRVEALHYDQSANIWRVTVRTEGGEARVIVANAVINAHGVLNRWALPNIPGLDRFKGPVMHTANWDRSVDVAGKRVVQIGTGASGHQLAPAIAPTVERLTILQRSRYWVMSNPEVGREVTDGVKWALRCIPFYKEWYRFRVYWFTGDGLFANVVKDPDWPQEKSVSGQNEIMRQVALHYIGGKLSDRPDLLEKVIPDHPIFSKRILMDAGWLDTLKRDNVVLDQSPIDHIDDHAVVMKDGTRHEADVLALATGFNLAKMVGNLTVIGRDGRDLGAEWGEDDPRSYLGVTIPGFPNLFWTIGPNSAPNHAAGQNIVSESQVNYIIECLDAMRAAGGCTIEPRQHAFEAWNEQINARMQHMIWTHPKANSYYNNSKGRVWLSWPYRLVDYWQAMRGPDLSHFEIVGGSGEQYDAA